MDTSATVELRVSTSPPAYRAFVDIANGRNRYQFAVVYQLEAVIMELDDFRTLIIDSATLTHIGPNTDYMEVLSRILLREIKARLNNGSVLWGIDNFQSIMAHIGSMSNSGSVHIDKIVLEEMRK